MTDANRPSGRQRIIILGALSAMAEAAARRWAEAGARLLLAGRDAGKLEDVAADLRTRGAEAETWTGDLVTVDARAALAEMVDRLDGVDIVLVAYGVLGEQTLAEHDPAEAERILATNFTSAGAWCLAAADLLEKQDHGTLLVIGSVAGDRGRQSNYVYGAAKGGLGILVQGIAHRLTKGRARAVLIKPGLVDTPMTTAFAKGPLWAKPDAIAAAIVKAGDGGGGPIVYAPGFWRLVMLIIRSVPSFIFHKTSL